MDIPAKLLGNGAANSQGNGRLANAAEAEQCYEPLISKLVADLAGDRTLSSLFAPPEWGDGPMWTGGALDPAALKAREFNPSTRSEGGRIREAEILAGFLSGGSHDRLPRGGWHDGGAATPFDGRRRLPCKVVSGPAVPCIIEA
jgi:hypothetical protein